MTLGTAMDMALLYSSLLPSPCRWHIRVRAEHQHCRDCPHPPCLSFDIWDTAGTATMGLMPQLELGPHIWTGLLCPSQPPTKIWPRHSSTSLIGLLHLLDHSDQHQAEKSWASFCFILKTNACSNSMEWGQGSSLMFKTIIQWLQFFAIRKLQDPRGCFPACCPQGSQMQARQSRFMERSNIFYEPNY